MRQFVFIIIFCLSLTALKAQQRLVQGLVLESGSNKPVEGVLVQAASLPYVTHTGKDGRFSLLLPAKQTYRLVFTHLSYQAFTKELKPTSDTLQMTVSLKPRPSLLDTVAVYAVHKPETLVAKPDYSIFDFDFYEDKLLLLTAERSLNKAQVQLADQDGKVLASYALPKQAGEALHFFHDYEGYTDIVCKDSIFRLDVVNTELMVMPIPQKDFNRYLVPVADTLRGNYYYSDRWDKYPMFNYYYLGANDTVNHKLITITNDDLMKLYNLEYYYLPSRLQLEARRAADYYKTDKHIIAAMMSGFTESLYYEALYAPLFILKDTICVFNHYNNFLYHFNKSNQLLDSVKIDYHHPKNWREWKRQLFVDETESKVYAFFSKDGHHYLRLVNYQTGVASDTYKLQHHSAERIKIKDGYVYYVYRPFGSTQERFLYRERIE